MADPAPEHAADRERVAADTSPLTPESFEALGRALSVEWPDWYRRFMRVMIEPPLDDTFWLPAGFLFAQPKFIYDDTVRYRQGEYLLRDESSRPIPWPEGYVAVGGTASGDVVIDTKSEAWEFKRIDRELRTVNPLFDGADLACTPEDLARRFRGWNDRWNLRKQMENRMHWEAEALRHDPGRRYDPRFNSGS